MTNFQDRARVTEGNSARFQHQFATLNQAAVGVIMVRTREPSRALKALRMFAFSNRLDFRFWNILDGWTKAIDANTDEEADRVGDPMPALLFVGSEPAGSGIFVMHYLHYYIPKIPPMVVAIKKYAEKFASNKKRLVLMVPHGFTLPSELEDDVLILDFDTPSAGELGECITSVIQNISEAKRPKFGIRDREQLVAVMSGMTAFEAETALSRSLIENKARLPNVPMELLSEVLTQVKTEVVKRTEILEVMASESAANIGGLDNLKEWLAMRAKCFSPEARAASIDPPKGIALIGPPGTGKSLVGKATAHMLGLPLIRFDVGRVFGSLVGQSEERVRTALKMVDGMAPLVLMIDEADKAFQVSGGGDSGVGQRVLGAILTWMQETKSQVFVVVTANRVDNLPAEFLRRGRLDEVWSVSIPNEGERLAVLKIHLAKRGVDPNTLTDLDQAVTRSNGYVPAELEGAVKDAKIISFCNGVRLTGALIADQLSNMVPLSEAFKAQFDAMEIWARNNARPANSSIAGMADNRPRVRQRVAPVAATNERLVDL